MPVRPPSGSGSMSVASASFWHVTDAVHRPLPRPVGGPPPEPVSQHVHTHEDQQDEEKDDDHEHPCVGHVTRQVRPPVRGETGHHCLAHVAGSMASRYISNTRGVYQPEPAPDPRGPGRRRRLEVWRKSPEKSQFGNERSCEQCDDHAELRTLLVCARLSIPSTLPPATVEGSPAFPLRVLCATPPRRGRRARCSGPACRSVPTTHADRRSWPAPPSRRGRLRHQGPAGRGPR